jgi:hypothetical protein
MLLRALWVPLYSWPVSSSRAGVLGIENSTRSTSIRLSDLSCTSVALSCKSSASNRLANARGQWSARTAYPGASDIGARRSLRQLSPAPLPWCLSIRAMTRPVSRSTANTPSTHGNSFKDHSGQMSDGQDGSEGRAAPAENELAQGGCVRAKRWGARQKCGGTHATLLL